jgi:hypothetical protein
MALGRALTIAALGLALRMRTWNRRAGRSERGCNTAVSKKPRRSHRRAPHPSREGDRLMQNPGANALRHG